MPGQILLAADGSEYALAAAEHAIDLARDRGAALHVLCVVDTRVLSEPGLSSAEYATIQVEDQVYECIAEVASKATQAGVAVEGATRHGDPTELIVEYADDIDADVVVVGEHGDHRGHLGGVRRSLLSECEREIVVVPAER